MALRLAFLSVADLGGPDPPRFSPRSAPGRGAGQSAGNTVPFSVDIIAWATIYFIAFAQINAVAALADRKGKLVSAVGSAFTAGVTIAPFIGGSLVDAGGYTWLGAAEISLTILIATVVLAGMPRHIEDPD